jgi:hypothetical protein
MMRSLFYVLLTPIDPNGSTADSHVIDAQLAIDVLERQGFSSLRPATSNRVPSLILSGPTAGRRSRAATLPSSQFLRAALRLLRLGRASHRA